MLEISINIRFALETRGDESSGWVWAFPVLQLSWLGGDCLGNPMRMWGQVQGTCLVPFLVANHERGKLRSTKIIITTPFILTLSGRQRAPHGYHLSSRRDCEKPFFSQPYPHKLPLCLAHMNGFATTIAARDLCSNLTPQSFASLAEGFLR